jgi:hypothetical protein
MASFAQIYRERTQIAEKYFTLVEEAQKSRSKEFIAAIRIQLIWRIYRRRISRAHEHKMAVVIQKRWRKTRANSLLQCLRVEKAREQRIAYFNKMATEIQRVWRGYDFRRHVFDYWKQKRYLQGVAATNVRMRRELDDHYAITKEDERRTKIERERRRQEENALRSHHLVSTAAIPSIFQPPSFTKDAEAMPAVENFIRNINKAHVRKERRIVVPTPTSTKSVRNPAE